MFACLVGLAALGGLGAAAPPAEEPFAIDLEVRAGKASKVAHAQPATRNARPREGDVLETRAGEPLTVRWKLSSTAPKATLKNVLVHFYAVKEEKPGQQGASGRKRKVVAETALRMDFAPKDRNEGQLRFTIDTPGSYLFRVETIGASAGPLGHEDFAGMIVKVR